MGAAILSRRFVALSALALFAVAAACLLAFVPGNAMVDDSYISFRFAENLAGGKGLVFNAGDRVEGYTNFLWVVILAAARTAGADVPSAARHLGFFAGLGTLGVSFAIGRSIFRDRPALVAALPSLLLATNRSFWYWAVCGLETPLFALLVVLGVHFHLLNRDRRDALLATLSLFAATLTRPEGALVFGLLTAHRLLFPSARAGECAGAGAAPGLATRLRGIVLPAAVFTAGLAPYLAWKLWYFGSLLPNTFYAKGVGMPALIYPGLRYVRDFAISYGYGLGVLGAAASLFIAPRGVSRAVAGLPAGATAVYFAYVAAIGGDIYYHYRYLVPLAPLFYLALTAAAIALDDTLRNRFGRLPAGASAAALLLLVNLGGGVVSEARFSANMARELQNDRFRERVARWLVQGFPPDTTIATPAVGIVPYLTGFPTIDMVGLVDREIGRSQIVGRRLGPVGHLKSAADSVLRRRPQFVDFGAHRVERGEITVATGWPLDFMQSGAVFYLVQPIYPARRDLMLNPDFHRNYRLMAYPLPGEGDAVMTFRRFPPGAIPESEAMANLGWALWSVGSREQGVRLLQWAAASDPADMLASSRLALITGSR